jgi:hypothetical protein
VTGLSLRKGITSATIVCRQPQIYRDLRIPEVF